jgi:hypothetical protein
MARPKRMGAYNALDDLLPGPGLGPGAGLGRGPGRRRRRAGAPVAATAAGAGPHALDDLLPGRERRRARRADGRAAGPAAGGRAPAAARGGARPRSAGRHLGVWNPLDGPPRRPSRPAPVPAAPAKARVGFRLPADLVETARDAVAHLAGTADQTTLTALTERALRVELARWPSPTTTASRSRPATG